MKNEASETDPRVPESGQPARRSRAVRHRFRSTPRSSAREYGGISVNEAKRLRELEAENGELKKLLAESLLDAGVAHGFIPKVLTPQAKREAVAAMRSRTPISERSACRLVGSARRAALPRGDPAAERRAQGPAGRVGRRAAPLWLSTPACAGAPRRLARQPRRAWRLYQEAESCACGGNASGASRRSSGSRWCGRPPRTLPGRWTSSLTVWAKRVPSRS